MHQLLNATRINSAVQAARERGREVWLSDDVASRGTGRLLLRVGAKGSSRFYFRASLGPGQLTKTVSIGMYWRIARHGYFTLNQARKKAMELASQLLGNSAGAGANNPSPPLQPAPPSNADTLISKDTSTLPKGTLLELCRLYAQTLEDNGKKSANEIKRLVERSIAPSAVAHKNASEVTSVEITEILRGVIATGSGLVAKKIRSLIHTAYARASNSKLDPTASQHFVRFGIQHNPVVGIDSLSQYAKPRNRFLRDSELMEVWRHLQLTHNSTIALRAVRLCILLGGQRGEQMLTVSLADVDLEAKTILLLDSKGRRTVAREHLLPLCPHAEAEVRWLVDNAKSLGSSFLFPGSRRGTVCRQTTMSNLIHDIRLKMESSGKSSTAFAFIDLRRTIETKFASWKIPEGHRAQLLSHGLGGVQNRHYDRHDYMDEKLSILHRWEKYLATLVTSTST